MTDITDRAHRLLLGTSTALLAASLTLTSASAADLGQPRRSAGPPPAEVYVGDRPLAAAPWTGFYLGATYGAGFGEIRNESFAGTARLDQSGGIGTVFGGYNWQIGAMVVGLEADLGLGNLEGSQVLAGGFKPTSSLNALGSVRGRAGVLLTPSLMAYATGGFAWSDFDLRGANGVLASQTFSGYQLGAGLEFLVSQRLSLRLEYIYTDLGKEHVSHGGVSQTWDPDFQTVRAGLSFKF